MRHAIAGLLALGVLTSCQLLKPPQPKDMELKGDFSGQWGVNNVYDNATSTRMPCQDTSVEIVQTATNLTIGPRIFSCSGGQTSTSVPYNVDYQSVSLTLSGSQVLLSGVVVGTKSDSVLDLRLAGPYGSTWHINLSVAGPLVHYTETVGGNSSTTTADFNR